MEDRNLKADIGKRIEAIRKEMGKTKDGLAKEIGVTPQYLGIVEKGESALSYEKIERLCDISGYTSDYILFGKESNLEQKVKLLLTEFDYKQIQSACEAIKQIALFLKSEK